jgi:hypothetical protein
MLRRALIAVALLSVAACSKSPSSPSSPDASDLVQGQTVDAIDGAAAPSLSVRVGTKAAVTSDAQGFFEVNVGNPGVYRATVRGDGIVERETDIAAASGSRARVSLIPSSFDLTAFNEMFRTSNERLQRWTTRPALVVLATVMSYRNGNNSDYQATAEQLTPDEVNAMIAHLTEGLALLTGNTFTAFESVSVERPAAGERAAVLRSGSIVVGRYNGIVTMVNTIGYGQWADLPNGSVIGGSMFLDRDFDRSDNRRRLLRIHELGHALGYMHVASRTSIMNPAIGPEPNDFDRAGAIIAFQRAPGNRAPDIDPALGSRGFPAVDGGGARWAAPIYCR